MSSRLTVPEVPRALRRQVRARQVNEELRIECDSVGWRAFALPLTVFLCGVGFIVYVLHRHLGMPLGGWGLIAATVVVLLALIVGDAVIHRSTRRIILTPTTLRVTSRGLSGRFSATIRAECLAYAFAEVEDDPERESHVVIGRAGAEEPLRLTEPDPLLRAWLAAQVRRVYSLPEYPVDASPAQPERPDLST